MNWHKRGVRHQYVHQFNNMDELRKRTVAELFDIGLGGYKEWLDDNGLTKERECIAKNMIISYCQKPDFSDAVHIGEIITVESPIYPLFHRLNR
jgi:acyl-CoA hydrolase